MLQSGVRSSVKPGLPTHLVQELNVGTVRQGSRINKMAKCYSRGSLDTHVWY